MKILAVIYPNSIDLTSWNEGVGYKNLIAVIDGRVLATRTFLEEWELEVEDDNIRYLYVDLIQKGD